MLRAVADKYSPLILEALARAAAQPEGTPLFTRKGVLGLFPNSAVGKPAAQRALAEHWLQGDADGSSYVATNAGLNHLIDTQSPKAVLNDFVRVLEDRESQVQLLVNEAERLADGLQSIRDVLGKVMADEVDAGIVYVTDVKAAGSNVTSVAIPPGSNVTTTYPIATVIGAPNAAAARAFVTYVRFTTSAQGILRAYGFARPW